ncbi:MAG TPA: uroporphyrinogen decarboxylase family protein, partial [Candidatus Bathyarchaeia archaeon]|nr:uroporphyrinogen decarboxylase family protein [Candidatus Bathyarchaeia archaeon]
PSRPLLMPLTFSLAARLENLPLGSFAMNPTKIANALPQIRAALKLDGVTCYWNQYLEVQALGGRVEWNSEGAVLVEPPRFDSVDDLQENTGSAEAILKSGGIPVAVEVLRRLRVMLKDEPALMMSVTGPLKLAAQLSCTPEGGLLPAALVEFCAGIVATLSQHFVEAGADQVFLSENAPRTDNAEKFEWWAALLEPVINVVRFYDALPVLLLDERLDSPFAWSILNRSWDCVICLSPSLGDQFSTPASGAHGLGLALPGTLFAETGNDQKKMLVGTRNIVDRVKPVLLTSSTDIPANADIKQVASSLDHLREVHSPAR